MIEWLRECGPAGWVLPAVATVVLAVLLLGAGRRSHDGRGGASRVAPYALLAGLLVLGAAAEVGRFDGLPHVSEKFDATALVWARAVMLRAVAGIVVIVLALPMARVAARWAGWQSWAGIGVLVLAAPGVGMLASSVRLQLVLRSLMTEGGPPERRLTLLHAALRHSELLLAAGALVGLLGATALVAPRLWRADAGAGHP